MFLSIPFSLLTSSSTVHILIKQKRQKQKQKQKREAEKSEMLVKESGGGSNFDLPKEVLEFLPSDPFEQLDVARKIAFIALSTRVSALESESSAKLAEKDQLIADLQSRIDSLGDELSETADKLSRADEEKENLLKENTLLSNTVKKLNRDVSKLEVFKKTLMQSLQEYEENSAGAPEVVAKIQTHSSLSSGAQIGEDDAAASTNSSVRSEVGNSFAEDRETDVLPAQTRTPSLLKKSSDVSNSSSKETAVTSFTIESIEVTLNAQPEQPSAGRTTSDDNGSLDVAVTEEDKMDEEAPETSNTSQIGSGKKAVLGAFGQLGTGFGGGFAGTNSTGGFSSAAIGGGFAGLASRGGGFSGGGFAGAASAGGGFGAFSSQQGSCSFSAFSSGTGGTGKPPFLFTQVRK